MPTSYQNVTLGTLVTMLLSRLQQAQYWGAIELRENINEAIRLYQLGTLRWKKRFSTPTVAGQVFYDLTTAPGTVSPPPNSAPLILMPIRVAWVSNPLFFATLEDMDANGPNWQIQTTTTSGAPSEPQLWGNVGLNYLYIWPADAVANHSLQIDAAIQAPLFATDGSGDNNYLNLDSGEVSTLLDYAQHVCQFKRGNGATQKTLPKLKSFMKALALQNSFFAASSIYKKYYSDQHDRTTRSREAALAAVPRFR